MSPGDVDNLLKKLEGTPVKWKDMLTGTFFTATPETVRVAELELNEAINVGEYATIEDWCSYLGIDPVVSNAFDGWHVECLFENGVTWLTFTHGLAEDKENGLYFTLSPDLIPCDSFMQCHEIRWA